MDFFGTNFLKIYQIVNKNQFFENKLKYFEKFVKNLDRNKMASKVFSLVLSLSMVTSSTALDEADSNDVPYFYYALVTFGIALVLLIGGSFIVFFINACCCRPCREVELDSDVEDAETSRNDVEVEVCLAV